jgi:mono/diheme cytochrome c family protein
MKTPSAVRALAARPISVLAALIALATIGNALLVSGCGGKSQQSGSAESQPPAQATQTQSTETPMTSGQTEGSAADGKKIYQDRCVLCHGADGKGDGAAAAGLNPKPRNHTDGAYMNSRTNEQLLQVIHDGKGAMPAWGSVLSEQEMHAVLRYVRSIAVPPYTGPMP